MTTLTHLIDDKPILFFLSLKSKIESNLVELHEKNPNFTCNQMLQWFPWYMCPHVLEF